MNGRAIVIGCGGGGSWLAPKLCYLVGKERVLLIDKDVLEKGNLDRQLFNQEQIGQSKAESLAELHGITNDFDHNDARYEPNAGVGYYEEWFSDTLAHTLNLDIDDVLFCCADNHACRLAVLDACDRYDCRCVIAGNEYTDAEAYWYESSWRGTPNDPRVFYPEILTDHTGNPLRPEGCTGEAQRANRQLALVNDIAVTLAMRLFYFHVFERPKLERSEEIDGCWPVHEKSSVWKVHTTKRGDRQ